MAEAPPATPRGEHRVVGFAVASDDAGANEEVPTLPTLETNNPSPNPDTVTLTP